ncbi:MAG: NAD(P)/FAD-dependent oxidoreductase [Deltaproteobacteria bacterium]|nr:NAD(P)/FAD-dependent oxidoreductase [Deltaproteobacteria bacterium]
MAESKRTKTAGRGLETPPSDIPFPSVAIIGSGFGGLCMAIKLKEAGFQAITIFEKADRVGGTWRDNSYPGAACDVPSHLYSFSFEPKSDWSRAFPEQSEILGYIDHVADKYNLRPHIRFRTEVTAAEFDEAKGLWRIETITGSSENNGSRGRHETHFAHVLVSACGQLNRPAYPDIPGLDRFEGVQFHSARWNHQHSLKGRKVAVIGTGASAIQFVPPVAEQAGQLHVFQRTPTWILPKPDRPYMNYEKRRFRKFPAWRETYRNWLYWSLEARFAALNQGSVLGEMVKRAALEHLDSQVKWPLLKKALTPDYELGCKRILISNDYYPAIQRPNVALITTPVERFTKNSVVDRDGRSYDVDTVIFGTGFETTGFLAPIRITGLGGQSLKEAWKDGAEAFLGVTVAGFPNLFMLYGPNTNLGHNSILFMIECQVHYAIQCIRRLVDRRLKYLHPDPDRQREYNEWVQAELKKRVWATGCHSWYVNEKGKNTNNWPTYTVSYWRKTRQVDFSAYRSEAR